MQITPNRLLAFVCLCILALAVPAKAEEPEKEPVGPGVYVVRLAEHPVAAYGGGLPGFAATRPEERPRGGRRRLDAGSAASRRYAGHLRQRQDETLARIGKVLGREVKPLSRYALAFHGFALELSPEEAKRIARLPGVLQVERSREMVPQSDAGPAWIGAGTIWDGSGMGGLPGTQGEGMVVGVIDSGLNAGHPSFADVGGDGYDHTNPRGAGQYVGRCDPADPDYDPSIPCNDKLIGLRAYGLWDDEAPADESGHGTHVAAIAVGNHLSASLNGPGIDLVRDVSGVAPHANLIGYDVCPDDYCSSYLFLGAVDQAVADGVDVLTVSFGAYVYDPWGDSLAEALLNAREAGVFVAVPAGNGGYSGSLSSLAELPWVTAVTATTHDRRFANFLKAMNGGASPPPLDIQGWGVSGPYGPAPIVQAGLYGSSSCSSPFPAGTWSGQIVVCSFYPWYSAAQVSANVLAGGAGGVVLADGYSSAGDLLPPLDGLALPGVYIRGYFYDFYTWLGSGSGHTAALSGTIVETDPALADIVDPDSSKGPNELVPDVVKPDLAAPGVDILAADNDSQGFITRTGTSMANAHAAGAAALVMALHPDWSPSEVHSALVTTAVGTVTRPDGTPAEVFEVGSGRLDAGAAARAGLLLDVTGDEFSQADPWQGGHPEALNLPGLGDRACLKTCTWTRTVRSVLAASSTWTASSTVPAGFTVTVVPSSFTLAPGESRTVQITVDSPPGVYGWRTGSVVLTPSGGVAPPARLPVAVYWVPEYQLTVNRSGAGSGRVTSSPPGIDCGADCTELYPDETQVTLTAVPDPGSAFAGWSDDWYCDTSPTCTLSMEYQRSITAYFIVPAPDRALANGVPLRDSLNGPVENGTWNYYYVDVPAGTAELVVDVLDLTAEASLYVRQGSKPTWSNYNCADGWWGSLSRRCVLQQPAAGRWWIGVNNDDTGTLSFSVRAAWGAANGSDRLLTNGLVAGDFLVSSSAGQAWKYYFFDIESGATNLLVELSELSGDVDLLVRRGAKPDRSNHDCDSSQGSTLTERCAFPSPLPGRWWVAVNNFGIGTLHFKVRAGWTTPPTSFYTVQPCRVLDTRSSSPLVPGPSRVFQVTGACGIPATARAVVANVTAVLPTAQGHVTLHPGNQPPPLASTINFRANQVRANNGILNLPADGSGTLGAATALIGGGQVHLLVDVSGYFQ